MFKNINVVELKNCLACGSEDLKLTLNLNEQPLANSYKLNRDEAQEKFPLAINHCKKCHHVQLTHAVNPDLMFKDYLYVSGTSQTMRDYFKWFANFSLEYFKTVNGFSPANVFDIGCNDGSQLDEYKNLFIKTIGIDPAENLYEVSSKNHLIYLNYFDNSFLNIRGEYNYELIVAQNVFAHNYDPLSFLESSKKIMSDFSLMFIQTSQADMILNNEFDTIYHEHISFYNINSMNELCNRAGLNLIDVVKSPLHGNSYVFIVSKSIKRPYHIQNLIEMEKKSGLLSERTYEVYAERCHDIIKELSDIIIDAKTNGYYVIGYGAAAKGMTLLNYGNIKLDYIIDDNPLKQNRFTPGTSIPIVSSEILKRFDENDKIVFMPLAWNFFKEISSKIGKLRINQNDKFIKYFPEVVLNK